MVLRQAVNLGARGAGIGPRDHANEACAGCAPSRRSYLRARTPRPTSWRHHFCAHERIKRPWLSGRISCEWASSAERLEIAAPGGARWISAGFHVRPSPAAQTYTLQINSERHPGGTQMVLDGKSFVTRIQSFITKQHSLLIELHHAAFNNICCIFARCIRCIQLHCIHAAMHSQCIQNA